MNEIEEIKKRLYDLEHRVSALETFKSVFVEKFKAAEGDIKQIWMFIQNYLTTQIRKIGDFRVSKKTIATFFVSITLWIVTNLLRILDII